MDWVWASLCRLLSRDSIVFSAVQPEMHEVSVTFISVLNTLTTKTLEGVSLSVLHKEHCSIFQQRHIQMKNVSMWSMSAMDGNLRQRRPAPEYRLQTSAYAVCGEIMILMLPFKPINRSNKSQQSMPRRPNSLWLKTVTSGNRIFPVV